MPGDATISAKVTSQQNTDPWAKAGVMLRASTDPGARSVPFSGALPGCLKAFTPEHVTG
jgi:hypothetical protein